MPQKKNMMPIPYPQVVWVVPTTRCNTRCRTCGHYYNTFGEDMSQEVFRKIEDEVLDHVKRIHLVGCGEPLVSKIFPDMLEACIKRKIKIFFITNTIALTEELARLLVRNNAEIMISIDGATPETYNFFRPFIKFKDLLTKLDMLNAIREEYPGNEFMLRTNTVVSKHNIHELPDIVELAHKHKADAVLFSDLIPHCNHSDFGPDQVPCKYPDLIRQYAAPAVALARRYGIFYEAPTYYEAYLASDKDQALCAGGNPGPLVPDAFRYAQKDYIFPQRCRLPWSHANILVNGDVSTCCISNDSLGNLNEKSFGEIWNGAAYNSVRTLINTNNPPNYCRHCNLFDGILGGNPFFLREFSERNRIGSLRFDDAEVHASPPSAGGRNELIVDGARDLEIEPGEAEFLSLAVDNATGQTGQAVIEGKTSPFRCDGGAILLPISQPRSDQKLKIRLETSGLVRFTDLDLFSYEYKALNLTYIQYRKILEQFADDLAGMQDKLADALAYHPGAKKALIFGANVVGGCLLTLVQNMGLEFVGFVDNIVNYYDTYQVFNPEMLKETPCDIVLVSSKSHAEEISRQIRSLAQGDPVILTLQ